MWQIIRRKWWWWWWWDGAGNNPCESVSCGEYESCRMTPGIDGQYSAECVCQDQHCDLVVRPICASDGRSYDNECEMRRHSCTVRRHIYVRSRGLCGKWYISTAEATFWSKNGSSRAAVQLIDWLIFIEHKTNVYALVTIENKLEHIRGTGKNTKKYKHSYKTKHNGLHSYTYLNKHRGRKDYSEFVVHSL